MAKNIKHKLNLFSNLILVTHTFKAIGTTHKILLLYKKRGR